MHTTHGDVDRDGVGHVLPFHRKSPQGLLMGMGVGWGTCYHSKEREHKDDGDGGGDGDGVGGVGHVLPFHRKTRGRCMSDDGTRTKSTPRPDADAGDVRPICCSDAVADAPAVAPNCSTWWRWCTWTRLQPAADTRTQGRGGACASDPYEREREREREDKDYGDGGWGGCACNP